MFNETVLSRMQTIITFEMIGKSANNDSFQLNVKKLPFYKAHSKMTHIKQQILTLVMSLCVSMPHFTTIGSLTAEI